jgi:hypothetical protein
VAQEGSTFLLTALGFAACMQSSAQADSPFCCSFLPKFMPFFPFSFSIFFLPLYYDNNYKLINHDGFRQNPSQIK